MSGCFEGERKGAREVVLFAHRIERLVIDSIRNPTMEDTSSHYLATEYQGLGGKQLLNRNAGW